MIRKLILCAMLICLCACSSKSIDPNKTILDDGIKGVHFEQGQLIYIAIPPDIGEHPDDYYTRVEGTGQTAALLMKEAFSPYASKVLMGESHVEKAEAAKDGEAFHARYILFMDLATYYKVPILWEPSEASLIAFIFIVDTQSKKFYRVPTRLYAERGRTIPIDRIMEEVLPRRLSEVAKLIFNSENKQDK